MQCTRRAYEPVRAGCQPRRGAAPVRNREAPVSRAAPSVNDMTSIESVTLEVADPTAASRFYTAAFGLGTQLRLRASRRRRRPASAGSRCRSRCPSRPTVSSLIDAALDGRRHVAEAGREVALGLRRRRAGPGRDDLEGRDLGEEGHRPGHPADRRDRAPAGRRGRGREQAVLRRPRPRRGEELRPQVRRVRHRVRAPSSWRSTGAGPWPRTPASPPTAPDRTGSRSAATPGRSPTRTGSRGRPRRVTAKARGTGGPPGQDASARTRRRGGRWYDPRP